MNIYNTLKRLDLELPLSPPKDGVYQPVKQVGNLLYISGQRATRGGIPASEGKPGKGYSIKQGQGAARICILSVLSVLYDYLGGLDQIRSLIKILTFVTDAGDFNQQPIIASGTPQLLKDFYGEDDIGARPAIGVDELPRNIPVEVKFIFEI